MVLEAPWVIASLFSPESQRNWQDETWIIELVKLLVLQWWDHGLHQNGDAGKLRAARMDAAKATLPLVMGWLAKVLWKGYGIDANVPESILRSSYLSLVQDFEGLSFLALCPDSPSSRWPSCPPPWAWACSWWSWRPPWSPPQRGDPLRSLGWCCRPDSARATKLRPSPLKFKRNWQDETWMQQIAVARGWQTQWSKDGETMVSLSEICFESCVRGRWTRPRRLCFWPLDGWH